MRTVYTVTMTNKFGKSVEGSAVSEHGARDAAMFFWTHAFGSKEPRTVEVTTEDRDGVMVRTEIADEPRLVCLGCLEPHHAILDYETSGDCEECGEWL